MKAPKTTVAVEPQNPIARLGAGPHFMPDATYGVVRATGADDLERAGVRIVMTNAFHLMLRPGMTTIRALGGLKSFLGWDGVLATDSGGFQAYSLIRENSNKRRRVDKDHCPQRSSISSFVNLCPAILRYLRIARS